MSTDLVDELFAIAQRCAPERSRFVREPERGRERLVRLVEYAGRHAQQSIKLPSVKETKETLDQTDAAIERLLGLLKKFVVETPIEGLEPFYRLHRKEQGQLRHLPSTIWHLDQQLRLTQATLKNINADLDGRKHRGRKHEVHDIFVTCINFFEEFLRDTLSNEAPIRASKDTFFAMFVNALWQGLGRSGELNKTIQAEVNEYQKMKEASEQEFKKAVKQRTARRSATPPKSD
jgi:hypothetical protein